MANKKGKTWTEFVTDMDSMAPPITLFFDGKRTMQTWLGGVFSIMFWMVCIWYTSDIMLAILIGGGSEIRANSVLKAYYTREFHNMSTEKFMTGYRFKLE
jgi:hypothetical protein